LGLGDGRWEEWRSGGVVDEAGAGKGKRWRKRIIRYLCGQSMKE